MKEQWLTVKASHCKTASTIGLPVGTVKLSCLPFIRNFLLAYVQARKRLNYEMLFDIPKNGSLASWFNTKLADLFETAGVTAMGTTSHCFRRGTTSTLVALGMSPKVINRHLGWAVHSKMIEVYEATV